MSFDVLQDKIFELGNPTVVGLDPKPDYIPPHIMARWISQRGESMEACAEAFFEFNRGLIDALCDIVPAVKPQSAFYETLGVHGAAALQRTCAYARKRGMYVVMDAKRGDIGSTAEAYSAAYLGSVKIGGATLPAPYECDALTVNAYLGSDGIKPFLKDCTEHGKAIFGLVKTSNPSSAELQDLEFGGEKLYLRVGGLLSGLASGLADRHGYTPIGAVVGATYPEELRLLRSGLPETFFLVPGYGAQGGTAADVTGAFDKRGGGAIINSSRGIICAWKKTGGDGVDYAEAARAAALHMRGALRAALGL